MKNKILPLLFAFTVLFTANQASAYYSPSTGRWLSRDPMGEPGFETLRLAGAVPRVGQVADTTSLPPSRLFVRDSVAATTDPNRSAFVYNNPINSVDREGLSWLRNLFCPCECQSVTVTGKPSDPPNLGIYTVNGISKFGNGMTITWTVSGHPKSCNYYQRESGSAAADAITGSGQPHGSTYDNTYTIVTAKYDSNSATYPDYMGFALTSPNDNGTWAYKLDLTIDFICESSDGTKMTGKTIKFNSSGSFNFPQ
jgi:hypothetical protein